ncbi:hypothetical protein [Pseudonocardia spirodelae]|uniref:Uncharacterized protein n=1 Tax=Pseudonocardia spirodelae TaxID=3133431 RepID=A0ABU8T732_9PSEU
MLSKKKIGLVVAGTAATLAAAAPFAFAGDYGHDKGDHHGAPAKACAFEGGDAAAEGKVRSDFGAALAQAPVAGSNIGQAGNCSDFLNDNVRDNLNGDNGNGNFSHNTNKMTLVDNRD